MSNYGTKYSLVHSPSNVLGSGKNLVPSLNIKIIENLTCYAYLLYAIHAIIF